MLFSCTETAEHGAVLPDVPEGAQAVSLMGEPLRAAAPSESTREKYEIAKSAYDADPVDADNLVWYGRRTAYKGDYLEAIRIYTEGIEKFPADARMYRHRGHRYISIREFDRAVEDFEHAAKLIAGTEDVVEPDGLPNAQNIPVSSLHTNIWYHLGLAYYLKNDLDNALRVYRQGIQACTNDDMLVAMTHWLYMTQRLRGDAEDAQRALEPISANMNIIENMAYHQLCLFYKGELSVDDVAGEDFANIMNDAAAYGVGNWYVYNDQPEKAREVFERILKGDVWASFGRIAAEADYVRLFGRVLPLY